ncbi:CRISPR-associated helicase Cas3' [Thermococcus sp. JdF3]|nr:CRISPR-associated helicase Cas3' [Thermococcus sp. JdF3]
MSVEKLFSLTTGHEPYDYQVRAWKRIRDIMQGGGKVIIEVPTAGGKTEAAVMPFLAEVYKGTWAVSRLVYVLPTRSLVEKQAERIRNLLSKMLVLKGKAENEAKEIAEKMVVVEYGLEPTHAFLGPIVVTTWDAFLYGLAAHRTVGNRFTFPAGAIAQGLVVFDEVQMYQDESLYMPRLIALIVEQLSEANVPVVIMSATIPTELRKLIAGESDIIGVEPEDRKKPERGRVKVRVSRGEFGNVIEDIKNALKNGKKVLVVRNTVERAVSTYLKLSELAEELGVKPLLIHGRFTVGDRKKKERALDGASLIVATQVVEAGLDLPNIGLVVTDIAPLDALIQRIGRCARRKGEEGEAIVLIEELNVGDFPNVRGFSEVVKEIEKKIGGKVETEPFVEFENHKEYKRVVKVIFDISGKKETRYVGTPSTIQNLGQRKKPPKDLLVVPYEAAPYDPLVLMLTHDELDSLEEYLYDARLARNALDRVYRFHYANNLVPREFHSAYIYFRELKLFSAPPEYELRSRPELYAMFYVPENRQNDINFKSDRVVRVSLSVLKSKWDELKNCIKGQLKRRWDSGRRKYHWVLTETQDTSPQAFAIYVLSGECYSPSVGVLFNGGEIKANDKKEQTGDSNAKNSARRAQKSDRSRSNGEKQATLLDFAEVRT